jgi:hypothetical protein
MSLALGNKTSKVAYINARCQLVAGKKESEAIGTRYINSKGVEVPYSKSDLTCDLARGTLHTGPRRRQSYPAKGTNSQRERHIGEFHYQEAEAGEEEACCKGSQGLRKETQDGKQCIKWSAKRQKCRI